MDLRQIEMFRAVVDHGTFTAAAKKMYVSQSAISRQVKLLEEELGVSLLHRGARGVTLTRPGELLLALARRLGREVQDVVAQIAETQGLLRGSLTIAGGMTVCLHVLPPVVRDYHRKYPGIDLKVVTGRNQRILELLRQREVDLALLTLPIQDDAFEVVTVLEEEMVVGTATRHPLASRRNVDVDTLASYPQILYEEGSNTRRVQDRLFAQTDRELTVAMETENVEITKAMVRAELGVTLIPYAAIAREVQQNRLAITRLRGQRLFRRAGWVYLRSDYVPPAVTAMIDLFAKMEARGKRKSAGKRNES